VQAAAYTFTDKAYIILDKEGDRIKVKLIPKEGQGVKDIELEFHNQLINYSNYHNSMESNADVAKLIVERAMFYANPSLIDEAEEKEIEKLLKELDMEDGKDQTQQKPV
jgi:His-Xaa-Ser system protein HxsD